MYERFIIYCTCSEYMVGRMARRVRVRLYTYSDPCAAVEKPNPPFGTRLKLCGYKRTEVYGFGDTLLMVLESSCQGTWINGKTVPRSEFYEVYDAIYKLVESGELIDSYDYCASPCPCVSERVYLVPPDAYKKLRSLARKYKYWR